MKGRPAFGGAALAGAAVLATLGLASGSDGPDLTPVPSAQPRAAGDAPAHQLPRSCASASSRRARCRDPRGIIGWYGHENDAPSPDDPVRPLMVPAAGGTTEAQKTEPDKNTYLGAHGAEERRPGRRLRHPLPVPGHEAAAKDVQGRDLGDITRINRDADTARRVALMAWKDVDGAKLATIDGSTWDPFAQRLLFTTEDPGAPTYAATVGSPRRWRTSPIARPRRLRGHPERQGPERLDRRGPERPQQGRHEGQAAEQLHLPLRAGEPGRPGARQAAALQVLNRSGQPITFASQAALNAPDQVLLHSYGVTLSTRWVTVHDTAVDGTTPFDANGAAKAANATSLKRPENGVLRPGSHTQRDGLDSGYVFDTTRDYSKGAQPVRWLAEGRDATAALDAANDGLGKNDGDNEITGVHVSGGDPGPEGILGAHTSHLEHSRWRWFWTAQHGDNDTYEVSSSASTTTEQPARVLALEGSPPPGAPPRSEAAGPGPGDSCMIQMFPDRRRARRPRCLSDPLTGTSRARSTTPRRRGTPSGRPRAWLATGRRG